MDRHFTTRLQGPSGLTRWTLIAVMSSFVAVDVLLGERLFGIVAPAAVAGVVVTIAVAAAARWLVASTLAACATSIIVSAVVHAQHTTDYTPVMGLGAWPGVAELAGLGLLTGWGIRSMRPVGAATVCGAVAVALYALVDLRQDGPYRSEVQAILAAGLVAAIVAGLYLRRIDDHQAQQTLQARHDERLAIARELHDVVAHHVTGIVVQAQAARFVSQSHPAEAERALVDIEQAGAEALVAMRRMVGALRDEASPAPVNPAATLDDLRTIAKRTTELGLPVHLQIDGPTERLPPELAVSVHRIVRESLTNSQRHAVGATHVDVTVAVHRDEVSVDVNDDGRPSRVNRDRSGFGITGMAERVAALGGRFSAGPGPAPAGGWRVRADLPITGSTA